MSTFDPALWDGTDPSYAPGLCEIRETFFWRATPKYTKAGYATKTVKLDGESGDGLHMERAARCRELTREMVRWYEGAPKVKPRSFAALFARYKGDDVSPLRDVKANTRASYLENLAYWEPVIGHLLPDDLTYAEVKRIMNGMRDKGRSDHFIHAKFTMLRIAVSYGVALEPKVWKPVREILAEVRVKSPAPRDVAPTREQVMAVIAAADAGGDHAFATGLMAQWWLAVRAVDVRGQWLPAKGSSGIMRNGLRWQDGMTWDMIDADVTVLEKVASKTERHGVASMRFDLTIVPELRERLLSVPVERRVGPVIVDRKGLPYDRFMWADLWRTYRAAAGVPDDVQIRDVRAGAITEGRDVGASLTELQNLAGHASAQTTQRYMRERDTVRNNVIRMRERKQK